MGNEFICQIMPSGCRVFVKVTGNTFGISTKLSMYKQALLVLTGLIEAPSEGSTLIWVWFLELLCLTFSVNLQQYS